jgi:hypothetical protein
MDRTVVGHRHVRSIHAPTLALHAAENGDIPYFPRAAQLEGAPRHSREVEIRNVPISHSEARSLVAHR